MRLTLGRALRIIQPARGAQMAPRCVCSHPAGSAGCRPPGSRRRRYNSGIGASLHNDPMRRHPDIWITAQLGIDPQDTP